MSHEKKQPAFRSLPLRLADNAHGEARDCHRATLLLAGIQLHIDLHPESQKLVCRDESWSDLPKQANFYPRL